MIGKLTGRLESVSGTELLVDVGGVGYEVSVTSGVLTDLPSRGDDISLYTHQHVSSDNQPKLYGFDTEANRNIFRLLLGVQGVGPKVGVAILSMFTSQTLSQAIAAESVDQIVTVPGIGRKGAQKIILDLKPKLANQAADVLDSATAPAQLHSALSALGFSATEINSVAAKIDQSAPVTEQIRTALKELGGRR